MAPKTENQEKNRAVIYARFSCDKQREESIEGQIRECMTFARNKGFTVVKNYVDQAISARTDDRPQFQQMIGDARAHGFDVVIVWKVDRFSRSRYDALKYKAILKKNGVKLVSATETISDGPEGILLESVLDGLAEYYSVDLSEKVVRGMTENVINGKSNGGHMTFGYAKKDGKIVVDEHDAPIVQEIFRLYTTTSVTSHGLVEVLKERGLVRKDGRPLCSATINHILRNERYCGVARFREVVNKTSGYPRLVDDETFRKSIDKLSENRLQTGRHTAVTPYALFGKTHCGYCGELVRGYGGTSADGTEHFYYRCRNAIKKKTCPASSIDKNLLETTVVDEIKRYLSDDKVLLEATKYLYENQISGTPYRKQLERKRNELDKKIENILSAIEGGAKFDVFQERFQKLDLERKKVLSEIERDKIDNPILEEADIYQLLRAYRTIYTTSEDGKQALVNAFVKEVKVYDDKLEIFVNFRARKAHKNRISCSTVASDGPPLR
mgnify:CR=1 FL=1